MKPDTLVWKRDTRRETGYEVYKILRTWDEAKGLVAVLVNCRTQTVARGTAEGRTYNELSEQGFIFVEPKPIKPREVAKRLSPSATVQRLVLPAPGGDTKEVVAALLTLAQEQRSSRTTLVAELNEIRRILARTSEVWLTMARSPAPKLKTPAELLQDACNPTKESAKNGL